MRCAIVLALAWVLLGCEDPAPGPSPDITPDITPDALEETPPAPEPEVPAPLVDSAPAPVTYTIPEDPDALPSLTTHPLGRRITTRGGGWQVPRLQDAETRERVGMLLAHIGYAHGFTMASHGRRRDLGRADHRGRLRR